MNDVIPSTPSSQNLVKSGTKGVAALVVGSALLFLRGFGGIFGIVLGGALVIFGSTVSAKADTTDDRVGGVVSTAAGALTILASLPVVGGIASFFMGIGGFSLAVYGGVEVLRFIRAARRRKRL